MINVNMHWQSSLTKILPGETLPAADDIQWTALRGERTSIQLAAAWDWSAGQPYRTDLKMMLDCPNTDQITVYAVKNVPSQLPAYPLADANYLTTRPGLLPDRLCEIKPAVLETQTYWPCRLPADQVTVYWFEFAVPDDFAAESVHLQAKMLNSEDQVLAAASITLRIIPANLPLQTLRHTEWFHSDCLADFYQVDVFSDKYWQITGRFIKMAADHGVNMLLTPLFTPPLDTAVGGERTTVQLVDVSWQDGRWHFDFSRLKRWIDLAEAAGIRYFEMSHLFTQWGAKSAPKIMAEKDGRLQQVFGWNTPATGEAYSQFIAAFLPDLTSSLEKWGIAGRCYFHVSDEPNIDHLESYRQARDLIKPYLKGYPIIDALSDYDFYKTGTVEKPIPANNHIKPFLEAKIPGLWTYYCCGQHVDVSNRFMAMPSSRNRIIGIQLYLFQIEGFLHWGYNFYNNQNSVARINPYAVTDAEGAFPSGDAFLVYPGDGGCPEPSLRLKVFAEALYDVRALQLLESLTSREQVADLIHRGLSRPIEFDQYPTDAKWLLDLRNQINLAIDQQLKIK